jgi:uncharacterized protein YndB with AHSA1/START domain
MDVRVWIVGALLAGLPLLAFQARAEPRPLVTEAIINAPVSEVWRLFTTREGMESWMVAHADIELKVGGLMRTHYDPKGVLDDPNTIVNQILSFEPERMLSIKVYQAPANFPLGEAAKEMWTVIYFQPLEPGMTNVRVVGLGYGDDAESMKLREHFRKGNAWTLEQLQKKFWPSCALCQKDQSLATEPSSTTK